MPERAWILLPSGKQPGHLVPRASTNDDLAIGLSRTYRWAGGLGPAACGCQQR